MGTVTQTIQAVPINHYILLASLLFTIGVMGVLVRRNAIVIFMSIELMLNAVNILLAAFSAYRGDASGQVFVFFYYGSSCRRSGGRIGYHCYDIQKH